MYSAVTVPATENVIPKLSAPKEPAAAVPVVSTDTAAVEPKDCTQALPAVAMAPTLKNVPVNHAVDVVATAEIVRKTSSPSILQGMLVWLAVYV